MREASRTTSLADLRPFSIIEDGMPLLYEDEEEGDMGDASWHTDAMDIALYGVMAHLRDRPELQVFANLNLYYSTRDRSAYVSPDLMVAEPNEVQVNVPSYRIGEQGPAPLLVGEVLSERTAQQGDRREKLPIYAGLGIREYILIDTTGRFLPERLLLKRLRRNRTWKDEQDADGGVTSRFEFRFIIDADNRLRVVDARAGAPYVRPDEAPARLDQLTVEVEARRKAEERVRALEEELARLRGSGPKKGKGRRRKS
jgi:Uma2 family endonuclease